MIGVTISVGSGSEVGDACASKMRLAPTRQRVIRVQRVRTDKVTGMNASGEYGEDVLYVRKIDFRCWRPRGKILLVDCYCTITRLARVRYKGILLKQRLMLGGTSNR